MSTVPTTASSSDSSEMAIFRTFLDPDLTLIDLTLTNIRQNNRWATNFGQSTTEFANNHLGDVDIDIVKFLMRVKDLAIYMQTKFLKLNLYTDAAYTFVNANQSTEPASKNSKRKKGKKSGRFYSQEQFKNALVQQNICFWEPGVHHCLCCLFTKGKFRDRFEPFIKERHGLSIVEKFWGIRMPRQF